MKTKLDIYNDALWQPVELTAGGGSISRNNGIETGFFKNETGLQWSSTPSNVGSKDEIFSGWMGMFHSSIWTEKLPTDSGCSLQMAPRLPAALLPHRTVRSHPENLRECVSHARVHLGCAKDQLNVMNGEGRLTGWRPNCAYATFFY